MSRVSVYLFIVILSCCNLFSGAVCCCGKRKRRIVPIKDRKIPSFMDLFHNNNSYNTTQIRITPISPKTKATSQLFTDFTTDRNTLPFLITSMAFHISTLLNFIGYHLPLQNSSNVHKFQALVDYFGTFKNGMKGVDIKYIINNYDEMRDNAFGIWDIINTHYSSNPTPTTQDAEFFDQNLNLSINSDTSATTIKDSFFTNFWNTTNKWILHKDKPLEFIGTNAKQKPFLIKVFSYIFVPILMDRFYELITCNDVPTDMEPFNSKRFLLNSRKVQSVLLNSFFQNEFSKIKLSVPNTNLIWKILRSSYPVTKVTAGNVCVFLLNILIFLKQEKLFLMKPHMDIDNFGVKFEIKWLSKEGKFSVEMQFDTQMFIMKRYQSLDRLFRNLVIRDDLSKLRFKDIDKKDTGLILLYVLLSFNTVGGRCGFQFQHNINYNKTFVNAIFCEWIPFEYDEEDDDDDDSTLV